MAKNYHPGKIEPKWSQRWLKEAPVKAVDPPGGGQALPQKKFYALVEFPYPSGEGLHIGHAFTNTIMDILARKKRMEGLNVLHPMGWDAFGLPTENSAIKQKIRPDILTKRNTDRFREQDQRLGMSYNWEREVNTTDPQYYRWTQWIFVQLFKYGLAYKAEMPVGWCPSCKIILANEEIVAGKCERCGAEAQHRNQLQWLLQITKYADRLADELDLVDYPDYVKASQRNWIGRSEGITIDYPLVDKKGVVSCYSTRPDTNFGATFIVIAPEHPRLPELVTKENQKAVEKYVTGAKRKSELERTDLGKEKTGVFTGSYALNQLTGKKMPIWVADFVVLTAGTGIVVGVPAHDERDFAFAKKYGLEIIPVIKPADPKKIWDYDQAAFTDIDQGVVFNSAFLNGLPVRQAIVKIIAYLVKRGWGRRVVNYHLRDWIFSRQHYWGEPIPMVYCDACAAKGITWWDTDEGKAFKKKSKLIGDADKKPGMTGWFPEPEKDLPVELPAVEHYQPTATGESPLAAIKSFVQTVCPECGAAARRETDTMPNWAGSSWYYLRYCDPLNEAELADKKKLDYWLPVDLYLGGAEHTTLHLLYSRFWHKALNDMGVVPGKEPYRARRQHGVILGENATKMSKSRGNIINPDDVVIKFGADTMRTYLMFMGPYDSTMPWSTKGLEGCWRFLNRAWNICSNPNKVGQKTSGELVNGLHKLIKKVGQDIDLLKHNTAIAGLMEFLNDWSSGGSLSKSDAGAFVLLLAPLAPFMAEELWTEVLGNKFSVHQQPWPKFDPQLVKDETVEMVIQVNGKVRGQIKVQSEKGKSQNEVEPLARKEERVAKYLEGKKIRKTIFVPGKLINFVV